MLFSILSTLCCGVFFIFSILGQPPSGWYSGATDTINHLSGNFRKRSLSLSVLVRLQYGIHTFDTNVTLTISVSETGQFVAGAGLYLAVMFPAVSHAKDMQIARQAYYQEFDIQGRFIFEVNHEQAFIPSQTLVNSYWYVTDLCNIKNRLGQSCPVALIRGLPIEEYSTQLYAYSPEKGVMEDISDKIQEEIAQSSSR